MFCRLATLPTRQNFSGTRLQKRPKVNENSETGYAFLKNLPEPVEGEGIWGAPSRQLLIKYTPQVSEGQKHMSIRSVDFGNPGLK